MKRIQEEYGNQPYQREYSDEHDKRHTKQRQKHACHRVVFRLCEIEQVIKFGQILDILKPFEVVYIRHSLQISCIIAGSKPTGVPSLPAYSNGGKVALRPTVMTPSERYFDSETRLE